MNNKKPLFFIVLAIAITMVYTAAFGLFTDASYETPQMHRICVMELIYGEVSKRHTNPLI